MNIKQNTNSSALENIAYQSFKGIVKDLKALGIKVDIAYMFKDITDEFQANAVDVVAYFGIRQNDLSNINRIFELDSLAIHCVTNSEVYIGNSKKGILGALPEVLNQYEQRFNQAPCELHAKGIKNMHTGANIVTRVYIGPNPNTQVEPDAIIVERSLHNKLLQAKQAIKSFYDALRG